MTFQKNFWSLSLTNSTFNFYFLCFVYWMMRLYYQFRAEFHGAFSLNEMWKILSVVLQLFSKSSVCVQGSSCESLLEGTSLHPHSSGLDVSWVWGLLMNEPCWLIWRSMYCGAPDPDLSMFPFHETRSRRVKGIRQMQFSIVSRYAQEARTLKLFPSLLFHLQLLSVLDGRAS